MNVVVTTDELEAIPQSYEQLVLVRAFYGADTHDDHWLGVYDVTPREAGLLLCGLDPLVLKKDGTAGEADKKRAKRLGRRFRGYNKKHPADRSWRDWHAVAREIGADYHKGFDYFFDEVVRPSTGTVAVESATEVFRANNGATAATSASDAKETKEQRQDRRLQACIDAGLPMEKLTELSRLPDGISNVAAREGVTRQAFSEDVKAALKRRTNARRSGGTASSA